MHMKNFIRIGLTLLFILLMNACSKDSDIASHNLSKQADMFEIKRRIIFYNGITDKYILSIVGYCSIKDDKRQLEVVCKISPNEYKKHFLGLSNNVTYFAEQLDAKDISSYHYEVVFKPQSIIPDIDLRVNSKEK